MTTEKKWGIDPYNRSGTKHLWERSGSVGVAVGCRIISNAKWEALQPESQALHICKRCEAKAKKG